MTLSGRFVRFSLVAASLLGAVACSGAEAQLVDEAPSDSVAASSTEDAAGGSVVGSTSDSGGAASSPGSSGGGGSGSGSGGGGGSGSGSVGAPAPAQCPSGGTTENGSNDSPSSAITITSAACGTVSSVGRDWWKFTLSHAATKLAVEYSGTVTLHVTSDGDTVTVGPGTALPFNPGAEYFIEVSAAAGGAQPYVIVLEEQ